MVRSHADSPTVRIVRRRQLFSQDASKRSAVTAVPIDDGGSVIARIDVNFVRAPWETITCLAMRRYVRRSELAAFLKGINKARYINNASKAIGRGLSNPQLESRDWQGMAKSQIDCGRDAVIVAPTRGGKSMVFQGLALKDDRNIVFVIAPINALMTNQVRN